MIKRNQIELSLEQTRIQNATVLRQRRISRARWWFQQMHQVVEQARDWRENRASTPEQIALPLMSSRS